MPHEAFMPTEDWPLQEIYKRHLHHRIQRWGMRVAPLFEGMSDEERQPREKLFEMLLTSVERGDRATAAVVVAVDGYVRNEIEGPGPYDRGGGNIESIVGHLMCQEQFEGLFAIYESGKHEANG